MQPAEFGSTVDEVAEMDQQHACRRGPEQIEPDRRVHVGEPARVAMDVTDRINALGPCVLRLRR